MLMKVKLNDHPAYDLYVTFLLGHHCLFLVFGSINKRQLPFNLDNHFWDIYIASMFLLVQLYEAVKMTSFGFMS